MKTKIELVLDIVNWEHRYRIGGLRSGEWCINQIRKLMKLTHRELLEMWKCRFE